jgi:CheY-like chemotaxis protein
LTHAEAACVRARGVTNQLLTFAKGGAPVKTTASVRDLAVECTRFALSGSSVAPRFAVDADLWAADVDTVQIGQVVHNLVLNAMQAMPRGGVVDVMLQNIEVTPHEPRPGVALLPGKYVCLVVGDKGPGIGAEHLSHIFDPYFTTKEKGSGLGLAISYSIVRAHGGAIAVESQQGVGSRFLVYLPASANSLPVKSSGRVETASTGSGRVLLMDDDSEVAEVAQDMLESLGYVVQVAPSGRDAIDQFKDAELGRARFDAVILDLTVPGGMGGAEAVSHIKEIRPDVPVVVTSGYADDSVLARFRDYGFDGVLPKPFGLADLQRALEEADATSRELDRVSQFPQLI